MMKFPKYGLYAITQPDNKSDEEILSAVDSALSGGAAVIQYRDKRDIKSQSLAYELLMLCHHYHVPLIINDDIQLAKTLNADGVHLGKADGTVTKARDYLGTECIIGVSCYNDLNRARDAERNGADYVAFGRFYASGSKPLASPADISTLRDAKGVINLPIVAIGGILPENAGALLSAGADLLAVIGGVFNQDPKTSAENFLKLFE